MSELYRRIQEAVTNGDHTQAERLVAEALAVGLPPLEILQKGLVAGITQAGELWKANEFFLPEVVLAAEAFKAGMAPLKPVLSQGTDAQPRHKVVIGVVEGDVHDLGKNLVAALLQSAGFQVVDLGIDVPKARFLDAVRTEQPAILGLGAYMTTTMLQMKDIVQELEAQGLRDRVRVMVGGVPTSQDFADEVGADAWGRDALDAVQKALQLVGG